MSTLGPGLSSIGPGRSGTNLTFDHVGHVCHGARLLPSIRGPARLDLPVLVITSDCWIHGASPTFP